MSETRTALEIAEDRLHKANEFLDANGAESALNAYYQGVRDTAIKVLAALRGAAETAGPSWLPIETVPQDEDAGWLLGCSIKTRRRFFMRWQPEWRAWKDSGGSILTGYVTHWMPLPAPPVPPTEGSE